MPNVAIIGASSDPTKYGYKSLVAHRRQGWDVYPVNPKGGEIAGLKVYSSVGDIPVALNRVSLYLPPQVGLAALDEIAAKGCGELWLNPGADGPQVVARAQELGLNVIVACSIMDVSG